MMVMKDKLYKTHHKGIYYRIRRFFTFSLFSLTIVAAIAIPTYIASQNKNIDVTSAQEQVVEDTEQNDVQKSATNK